MKMHHALREGRFPTVGEIAHELRHPTGVVAMCWRHGRDGVWLTDPLEIWIEAHGMWLKFDGSSAGAALRGWRYYRGFERWYLWWHIGKWWVERGLPEALAHSRLYAYRKAFPQYEGVWRCVREA